MTSPTETDGKCTNICNLFEIGSYCSSKVSKFQHNNYLFPYESGQLPVPSHRYQIKESVKFQHNNYLFPYESGQLPVPSHRYQIKESVSLGNSNSFEINSKIAKQNYYIKTFYRLVKSSQ